jgi:hypothetical protein
MLGVDEAPNISAHQVRTGGTRRKSRTVDVAAIEAMDRDDCIERWRELFGVMPPKYTSLEFMRKAIAYEVQVKAFGGHSTAVQRALKGSLKAVRSEVEANSSADATHFDARAPAASASWVEQEGVVLRTAPNTHQTIQHNPGSSDACDQTSSTSRGNIRPDFNTRPHGNAEMKYPASPKPAHSTKPSVLSIRAGTHLVREWNGRTYQVEALDKGFRLDGKTYRSLSAIAKKITGAHWSGPRFFGLES